MLLNSGGTQLHRRPRTSLRRQDTFRYSAAINGTGEIQPIQEFIGRRFVRHLDSSSRLGKRLLVSGQVALWCDAVAEGERLPVVEVLGRLHERALREMAAGGGQDWDRSCRHRIETIKGWQLFYRSD